MFNDLFEDDPFIQQKKAEGLQQGLAEVEREHLNKLLRCSSLLLTSTPVRCASRSRQEFVFPCLYEFQ